MFISENNLAAVLGVSTATVQSWSNKGLYPFRIDDAGHKGFEMRDLISIPEIKSMLESNWDEEFIVHPTREYTSLELFAGGGGLALGMEKAGFKHILLNEFDNSACNTLRINRPTWNIIEGDVRHIDFSPLKAKVDFISGGFPCQAFSFAGKQGGFNDIRGTLFFELARAVKEIRPKVFMGENVKGLVSHDGGKTFATICNVIRELGYTLVEPRVLKAIMYQVPQKRERLILIAIRNDLADKVKFHWPSPYSQVLTLRDAFYKSVIYDSQTPESEGMKYPEKKMAVLSLVPEGGDWRDLPEHVAEKYMGGSWKLGGGKTGMARRLSLDEPSLTLTCSPCQKQTERCHPIETRPLTIREYARIQTFPDDWMFNGTVSAQYKQIGNAVPVNLAWAIGRSLIRLMNDIESIQPEKTKDCTNAVAIILKKQSEMVVVKNNTTQTSTIQKGIRQLNLFDLYNDFLDNPISTNCVCDVASYYEKLKHEITKKDSNFYLENNALIAYVRPENNEIFKNFVANSYHSGKKFPTTVKLQSLRYFIPYLKGKGIRDIYAIKEIKVGNVADQSENTREKDIRLIFDIEYLGSLDAEFRQVDLNIWHTYRSLNIRDLYKS